MDAISQTTFSRAFAWMKMYEFRLISLKFVPKGPINNIPALVQIMAWRRPGDKLLSEAMVVNLPTHIYVSRPQWVKLPLTFVAPIMSFKFVLSTMRSSNMKQRYKSSNEICAALDKQCSMTCFFICNSDSCYVVCSNPDSKVHGANMGPIWGRLDRGGSHVGPMNFAIWEYTPMLHLHMNLLVQTIVTSIIWCS